jgi:hypothetical protein
MSKENGIIIDLLSDSEEESHDNATNYAASGSAGPLHLPNNKHTDDDEVVILSDTDANEAPQLSSNNPIYAPVNNPYAKSIKVNESNASATRATTNSSSNSNKKEIHNPYKKKRKDSELKPAALDKKLKQPKIESAPETYLTELQAGLVFEEDIGHIQPNLAPTKKSGLKQASLFNKHVSLQSNENVKEAPLSAAAYAEEQSTTKISHNLQPMLFHDLDFPAGNPATVDGTNIIHKSKKSTDSTNANDFTIPLAPKCRCRPAKSCILSYSSKGKNIGRPYYKCQNNCCKYFSWAFNSYMLHWYRFGKHNGHVLVDESRGFRAEDLVQGKHQSLSVIICYCTITTDNAVLILS